MNAQSDPDLFPWLHGVQTKRAGSFLSSLADAALRADPSNFAILRPALLEIAAKYPEYAEPPPPRPIEPWCTCGAGEYQPPEAHRPPCPGSRFTPTPESRKA